MARSGSCGVGEEVSQFDSARRPGQRTVGASSSPPRSTRASEGLLFVAHWALMSSPVHHTFMRPSDSRTILVARCRIIAETAQCQWCQSCLGRGGRVLGLKGWDVSPVPIRRSLMNVCSERRFHLSCRPTTEHAGPKWSRREDRGVPGTLWRGPMSCPVRWSPHSRSLHIFGWKESAAELGPHVPATHM